MSIAVYPRNREQGTGKHNAREVIARDGRIGRQKICWVRCLANNCCDKVDHTELSKNTHKAAGKASLVWKR